MRRELCPVGMSGRERCPENRELRLVSLGFYWEHRAAVETVPCFPGPCFAGYPPHQRGHRADDLRHRPGAGGGCAAHGAPANPHRPREHVGHS